MPFVNSQVAGFSPQKANEDLTKQDFSPDFFNDVLPAAFERENTVGSANAYLGDVYQSAGSGDVVPESEFETQIQGYEGHAASFVDAETYRDFASIKKRIDRERENTAILDDAGWAGFGAEAIALVADPVNLIPGGVVYKGITAGSRVARLTATTAAAGGAAAAVAEVGLQATQETRTPEESFANIAAATVLSGVLGAGAGVFREVVTQRAIRDVEAEVAGDLGKEAHYSDAGVGEVTEEQLDRSVGAAQTTRQETTLEQETLQGALGLEKALDWVDPILRGNSSPAIETRQAMQDLAETSLRFNKNAEGIETPTAIETLVKRHQAPLAESLHQMDDMFVQYRKGRARQSFDTLAMGVSDLVSNTQGKLTRSQFYEAVGHAMRRGDTHQIPEVDQAAKMMREKVFNPLKEQAIRLGMLPEDVDVKTADSYLTRIYNTDMIAARRPEFEKVVADWLDGVRTDTGANLEELTARQGRAVATEEKLAPLVEQAKKDKQQAKADYRKFRDTFIKQQRDLKAAKDQQKVVESAVAKQEKRLAGFAESTIKRQTAKVKEVQAEITRLQRELQKRREKVIKLEVKAEELVSKRKSMLDKIYRQKRKLENLETNAVANRKELRQLKNRINDMGLLPSLERSEVDDIVTEITDKILGSHHGRLMYTPFQLTRGPIKERTLNIPDELIEPFLESNVESISRMYTRTMSADVELTKRFGDTELTEQQNAIRERYAELRKGVTDEKKLGQLNKNLKQDLEDVSAVRDRLRGTYAMPTTGAGMAAYRAARFVKTLNYVRLLGGMTVSAIPDLGRSVMLHGMKATFRDGLMPLIRSMSQSKLALEEAKLAGTALDMVLDTRAMQIADIMDDYGRMSKLERGLQSASQQFGRLSAMAPWNAAIKQFNGLISQTRTLRTVTDYASASKPDVERLASLGINKDMAGRIAEQYKQHGQKMDNGVLWANTSEWTDPIAKETYQAALVKEVDVAIVTPGQDKPLWMSTPLGSVVGQFRSFSFSSSQRVMMSGLQRKDAATLQGAVMMLGLGMLAVYLKNQLAGRDIGTDPDVWIKEGFDRSGLTGWLFDVNNIVEKTTGGAVGVSRLTGGPMMTRYQSRNAVGALLGPTFGAVGDAFTVTGGLGQELLGDEGGWSDSDTKAVRRLLPYQNIFYLRWLFDEAEEGVNETLGVKK